MESVPQEMNIFSIIKENRIPLMTLHVDFLLGIR